MNRVRAGYPSQLDDLAMLRREPADTVCFLDNRSNRSLHHSSNSVIVLVPFLLTSRLPKFGCREAIRTPVPGFKIQGPASRRPGITLSAVSPSCNVCTTPPNHRRCGQASCDQYVRDPPIRDDLRRDRSRAPTQARFQSLRVQSFVHSYLGSSEENRTPISALKGPHPGR